MPQVSPQAHGLIQRFLRQCFRSYKDTQRKRIMLLFHAFLEEQPLHLTEVEPRHVHAFLRGPDQAQLAPTTQQTCRHFLYQYLDWLSAQSQLSFDPQLVRRQVVYPPNLPELAHCFLASLTTLKPQSLKGYRTTLRSFYGWLDTQQAALASLTHLQLTDWFQENRRRGLTPVTQLQHLVRLRTFFRFCYEQNLLNSYPDELIRKADLPPLPSYLPRPLPPDLDVELQRSLAQSPELYSQGLLLMRNTGLRISELMALERDCVRINFQDHRFLKVPLGKLYTERLVPLDDKTYQLVCDLQAREPQNRRWLLQRTSGKTTRYYHYANALRHACQGLSIPDKMTTHRLRHTYATALLNGGMSLVGVMHLLGHRNIRTTLRYAAITQATVVNDYFKALAEIEKQYASALSPASNSSKNTDSNPIKLLSDVSRWLQKTMADGCTKKSLIPSLIKRITYLQAQIQNLKPDS